MGHFYVNYTLRGPEPREVARALAGRTAAVTPESNGCVVAFDAGSDSQDDDVMRELAGSLSEELRCPVLAVLNHDDDILLYKLFMAGDLVDEYNSRPDYFEEAEFPSGPAGGDAGTLCDAFGASDRFRVEEILIDEDYVFAIERHEDLVKALGISPFAVAFGHKYLERGRLPKGLRESDLIRVS